MLAGAALGAFAITGLRAQSNTPGAYVIVDISAITNDADFRTLLPKAGPAITAFGGKFVARTENIVSLDGTAP
jgi:uncharacterized protein (DUF1330 family)